MAWDFNPLPYDPNDPPVWTMFCEPPRKYTAEEIERQKMLETYDKIIVAVQMVNRRLWQMEGYSEIANFNAAKRAEWDGLKAFAEEAREHLETLNKKRMPRP